MSSQTNVVLVHGAWCDGSSWSGVIPFLQDAGCRVIAVQLPLNGLAGDVAITQQALASLQSPTILVGHSYGGAVISGAGTGATNVVGLVYVAAYAPAEGETILDINGRFASTAGVNFIRPAYGEGKLWIDPDAFPGVFVPDVDPAQGKVLAAVQNPITGATFADKATAPAWQNLPSWYIVSAQDQIINPDAERWMAERIGATTSTLQSSHASPVSHPGDVAAVILEAARAKALA